MCLGDSLGVPPFFWPEVDKLAMKILVLILPAINWVRRTWPPDVELIDIKTIYEHIHHCVAYAAWFSVNIKLSPSPFLFNWLSPGDRYMPDQVELYPALHSKSRLKNTERDYNETFQRAINPPPGSQAQTPPPRRLARVMISVAPCVQIFTPVRDQESRETVGQNVTTLTYAHVVYYHGLEDDVDDENLFSTSLVEYARVLKPRRPFSIRRFSRRVVAMIRSLLRFLLFFAALCAVLMAWWKYRHVPTPTYRVGVASGPGSELKMEACLVTGMETCSVTGIDVMTEQPLQTPL